MIYLTQVDLEHPKVVYFGPVKVDLGEMFSSGLAILCFYQRNPRYQGKVQLICKGPEGNAQVYTLYKVYKEFLDPDLSSYIKNGTQMFTKVDRDTPYDPFESLKGKYKKVPRDVMIGNKTIEEYVDQVLG